MEELKPCPFCGGEASLFTADEIGYLGDDHFTVKCGCCFCGTGHYADPERAIEAWNRRAAPENKPLTLLQFHDRVGLPVWVSGIDQYGIIGRKGIDTDDTGETIYRYVIGFGYGWEWLEDVLTGNRKAYARKPEQDPTP